MAPTGSTCLQFDNSWFQDEVLAAIDDTEEDDWLRLNAPSVLLLIGGSWDSTSDPGCELVVSSIARTLRITYHPWALPGSWL